MRLLRIGPSGSERPAVQNAADSRTYDASPVTADYDSAFFAADGPARLARALDSGELPPIPEGQLDRIRIGPPIARPGKIVCIGRNYAAHLAETATPPPSEPVIVMKAPSSLTGPYDQVLIPRGSRKADWELELAVVMGAEARYLDSPDQADDIIAGYAIGNDVSERDFQQLDTPGGQWDKGKSCETFFPLGPWLVTRDEIADPQHLDMHLSVNGETRQSSNTKDMVFGVRHLVWYISQFMVLEPGDVISTGTPAGVAMGMDTQPYLRAGDVMRMSIKGLGEAQQSCVQA